MKEVSVLVLCGSLSIVAATSAQTTGVYWQDDACTKMELGMGARVAWCVDKLIVTKSRQLELVTSWQLSGFPGGMLEKGSDEGNENMYLVDNLGNRYDHVATRGAARDGGDLSDAQPLLEGVFVFPPPKPGAHEFTFHDDDQQVAIRRITSSERVRSDRARSAAVLGRLRKTSDIDIEYRANGPNGNTHEKYGLRANAGGFVAEGFINGDTPAMLPVWLVPSFDVDAFLGMLAESPIIEGDGIPRLEPSEHFRSMRIELTSGAETVLFLSESQSIDDAVWVVETGDGVYVVPDDTPGRALQMLDRYFGRDLASRALKLLSPRLGEARASELWTLLDGLLGTEHAYKIAFRLNDLLGRGQDAEVWKALDRYLESKKGSPRAR